MLFSHLPETRHFIDSAALSESQIESLLTRAQQWLAALDRRDTRHNTLANRTLVTLFQEPSTRTRASFELAAQYLGAHRFTFSTQGSSLAKGETLDDTLRTFMAMGTDAFIVRHAEEGLCADLVDRFGQRASFINAGEGISDHPTQGLLDLFTLLQHWNTPGHVLGHAPAPALAPTLPGLRGKTVAIVGDVRHSRVARANLALLPRLGVTVRLVGPSVFCPPELAAEGVTVHPSLEAGLHGVDAVMALRIQRERLSEELDWSPDAYISHFQVRPEHLERWAHPGAILLHPGPTNWGVELSADFIDHPASRIEAQVRHGVAVRMAVLASCLGQ